MYKSFKFRLKPTEKQVKLIEDHFNSVRFVYNLALETKITAYSLNKKNLSKFDLMKQLPELKKDCYWLKNIGSQCLQQSIIFLDQAYENFHSKKYGFPKYKKKQNKSSFTTVADVKIKGSKIFIQKFREGIDLILHRPISGVLKRATISKTSCNKYFVSIICDIKEEVEFKSDIVENKTIGIDLGIKTFLVTSDGEFFDNPKFLRNSLSKLKYVQRKFSKNKSENNRLKLSKLHEKIINQRNDFLHKTSSKLINSHDTICIEDLNVKGLVRNHSLALSITDASWGKFISMLQYKAEWYGKNVITIGRFEPSSKACNCCGSINKELKLKDREWTCSNCDSLLDRDLNAAINIKKFGLKNKLSEGVRFEN